MNPIVRFVPYQLDRCEDEPPRCWCDVRKENRTSKHSLYPDKRCFRAACYLEIVDGKRGRAVCGVHRAMLLRKSNARNQGQTPQGENHE